MEASKQPLREFLACSESARSQNRAPIWFPHCPTCAVISSLGIVAVDIYIFCPVKLRILLYLFLQFCGPTSLGFGWEQSDTTCPRGNVGGARGGADQFSWENVKADEVHRETILGIRSWLLLAGGRGKDLLWFTKKDSDGVRPAASQKSQMSSESGWRWPRLWA